MANDSSEEVLKARILESSKYFSALVELVPPRFYEVNDGNDNYLPKQRKKGPQSKRAERELRKQLAKRAKYLKLDPGQHKSIKEFQELIEEREKAMLEESSSEGDSKEVNRPLKPSASSVSLGDLKLKLHQRLADLQSKRNRNLPDHGNTTGRLERKINKKVAKKKSERKMNSGNAVESIGSVNEMQVMPKESSDIEEGNIMFSKLDFNGPSGRKRKQSDKRLLQKAEAKKKKLAAIEKEDVTKATEIKNTDMWQRALKHAEGVKVKDDPKLLKKTIKRKEKQKQKSAKKWQERIDQQKKLGDEKQRLRKEHIKERKENKKKGKGKRK